MKNFFKLIKFYPLNFLGLSFLSEVKRKLWREKLLGSYSQNYEDIEIEKILGNKKMGRYLEIGGYHPTRLSNTYRFYIKGWTGVVVEPNPEAKNIFKEIRPKDNFLNIGVSKNGGNLKYYKYLIPALNSFSKINNGHKIVTTNKIKTKKIAEIVKENFDFLSIDTEGYDEIILKNWPWEKYKPKVICVEGSADNVLKKQGYRLVFANKFNSIYCI